MNAGDTIVYTDNTGTQVSVVIPQDATAIAVIPFIPLQPGDRARFASGPSVGTTGTVVALARNKAWIQTDDGLDRLGFIKALERA